MEHITINKYDQPYIPEGREIRYVDLDNEYMHAAFEVAKNESVDKSMQIGSVIVKDSVVLSHGANGSNFHENNECERVLQNMPTGQGYELCEGCHPKNHSEPTAIRRAIEGGHDTNGADIYLWGHWWCCQPCWGAILDAGIKNVYLLENSDVLFNKEDADNIIGKQIEYTNKILNS